MLRAMRLGSSSDRRIDTELWARKTSVTLVYGLCQAYDGISHDPTYRYGRSPCPKQRNPRSGSIGHARYRCWGPPGCRCRWRAAHLLQRLGRQRTKSLSVRRKSLTSSGDVLCLRQGERRTISAGRATSPPRLRRLQRLPAAEAATEAAEAARRLRRLRRLGRLWRLCFDLVGRLRRLSVGGGAIE